MVLIRDCSALGSSLAFSNTLRVSSKFGCRRPPAGIGRVPSPKTRLVKSFLKLSTKEDVLYSSPGRNRRLIAC